MPVPDRRVNVEIWLSRRCLDLVVLVHSSSSELNLNVRHR